MSAHLSHTLKLTLHALDHPQSESLGRQACGFELDIAVIDKAGRAHLTPPINVPHWVRQGPAFGGQDVGSLDREDNRLLGIPVQAPYHELATLTARRRQRDAGWRETSSGRAYDNVHYVPVHAE